MTEAISAALLDMSWHTLPADAPKQDVDAFEAGGAGEERHDLGDVPPRYRSSYFLHIWGERLCGGLLRLLVDADAGRRRATRGSTSTAA